MIAVVEQKERREDEGEVSERREEREAEKDGENSKNRRMAAERGDMEAEMRWRLNPENLFFSLAEQLRVFFSIFSLYV